MTPDEGDGLIEMRGVFSDFAIGPAQVFAPGGAEHATRGLGLRQPLVHRAVAAHLAGGEIAQPDAQPARRMVGDGPAEADFQIVGMRSEHEEIDGHQRVNSNAWSDASASSRWCRSRIRLARYAPVTLWLESPNANS